MSIGPEGNRDTVRIEYSQELLVGVDFFAWSDQSFRAYFAQTSAFARASATSTNKQEKSQVDLNPNVLIR